MTIGSKEAHKSGTENVAAIGYAPVTICGRCWLTLHDPYPPHRSRYAGIFHFAFQMTRNSSPAETRRSLGSRLSPSCRYHAADSKRGSRTTQNWPFCVATARRTNHKWKAPNRRSEIVRTNNNAPLVTLCNCEERCRLQTSAQEDQRIRALSRTPLGDDGLTPPLGKPERFGDSDIRGIGDSQRKVLIRIHQVGDPRIIGARQVDGSKVSISQRRAGRLLIVSLLLPGQARQGSG